MRAPWEAPTAPAPVQAEEPKPRKENITWADVKVLDRRGNVANPRVRIFAFSRSEGVEPSLILDKYGPGRDQYAFPINERVGDNAVRSWITTASRGLIDQIKAEVRAYSSDEFFKRMYCLFRTGEGMKTTYTLRGYDSVIDAEKAYAAAVEYLRGLEQ